MDLGFQKLPDRAGAQIPTRSYGDDAGLDLHTSESVDIQPFEFRNVPCGVVADLPTNLFGLILGRSSTWHKRSLLVLSAVIDPGWRGELIVGCFNLSGEVQTVAQGDRIAQLVLLPNVTATIRPIEALLVSKTDRGINGFGSSGL